jgi:hypothetical protein
LPTSINPQTRRADRNALEDFMKFTGIERMKFREITRAHIIAWRDDLKYWKLSGTTLWHRLGYRHCSNICAIKMR